MLYISCYNPCYMARSSTYSGTVFQKQFRDSCRAAGHFVHRIKDNVYATSRGMRSEKSPADFIVIGENPSHSYLVECKAVAGKSIPLDRLEKHQLDSLIEFDAISENTHGVVAVNMYDGNDCRGYNRLFLVPIAEWVQFAERNDRKSIPLSYLEESGSVVECERKKGSIWEAKILR